MVHRGVGANHQDEVGVLDIAHRVADRTRAHALEQGGHAGGVAQSRAVIHVVAAKAGAHQFLEQVGLFVAAFGRAKTGQRFAAVPVLQIFQAASGHRQRLFPSGGPEHFGPLVGAARDVQVFAHPRLANQGLRQALRMVGVVKAKAPLDAQTRLVGRAFTPFDLDDALVAHVVGDLTAHATKGANRVHLAVDFLRAHQGLGIERPRRAGLHALTAGHTTALAHGIGHVKHDARVGTTPLHANHLVDLLLAAGPHAAVALNAGIQVHRHRRVGQVLPIRWRRSRARQRLQGGTHVHVQAGGPVAEFAVRLAGIVFNPAVALRWHVGQQHLQHHFLALLRPGAVGLHHHAFGGQAATTGRQRALALHLDHAGAAIAVGPVALAMAEVGNPDAQALGGRPQGFAGLGLGCLAIQLKMHGLAHALPACTSWGK